MKKIKLLFTLILIISLLGCSVTHKPFHFKKVLGVTYEGDTVLVDVNSLRFRVYNTYQYNNTKPYYRNIPYNPQIIIRPAVKPKPRRVVKPKTKPVSKEVY